MSDLAIGLVGIAGLLVAMALRVPVGLAMLVAGILGSIAIAGPIGIMAGLSTLPVEQFSNHALSIVPLFLLMGAFAGRAGLSRLLFGAARDLSSRRAGHGHHRCLCGLRLDLRLVARHRRHHDPGGPAGNAPP
ncbi:hypothetical protein GCM10011505_32170 [Tistrella bauzanensis]|uniref:TRAP C4-dicarboxylate transport system permease DctM subunit domain-containing protein n=1 Tax=Tistrella bauzanensis TaxID=657419 RepID=A0ABQ1IQF8_9PROT|nr:hypothetical protein GCM10011505_32170 [Tistrella bauzanensis]